MDMGLDRRGLLQRALLLVGATAISGATPTLIAAATAGRRQLDAAHYALLIAVADTILPTTDTPGAVAAGVPQLGDALLGTWASHARRSELIGALDTIDKLAMDKHQRKFPALTAAERIEVLTPHDVAALKSAPRTPPPALPVGAAPTTVDPSHARAKQEPSQSVMDRMSPHLSDPGYGKLKELIVVGFYYSETALTHDLAYEHTPGVWLPSIPLTPATRPWGGPGLI
jgi:hypothetical protein